MGRINDVALDGGKRQAAVLEPVAPARSAASRLLASADIWSGERAVRSAEHVPEQVTHEAELPTTTATTARSADIEPAAEITTRHNINAAESPAWPPRKLSLALQGGGTFAAFTWGVLERLLEEPDVSFDAISGASAGAVNAVLLASGLAEGGRERARARLDRFWQRVIQEASFRSLMLLGAFSPAGSSVAFGPTLRSGHFDPFDLDPLRRALARNINFEALRAATCPKLLIAATRIRDGYQQIFTNEEITADAVLASTCPPQIHCAVEIDGEAYWDGGYGANPPLVRLVQESAASDLLVVQVTPSRDSYVPITLAAIDRRLDQITANSALNAELAALEWARRTMAPSLRIFRIAAEDEIDGLAQRSATDLGRGFVTLLHRKGRSAADRWLRQGPDGGPASAPSRREAGPSFAAEPALL
ncbi:MAG: patatin-like phospholipase family protein [Bradyrhizobium sp.]|uniref:patatin-like phospholipase family protein n=1 Tax=Bradyrhizobium sp. TaxID=376 RepID=UPI0025B9BFAE|nr:patatin-like phospholipase family protein [Bradyrhizobium sp.]MBI5264604.1 patatin-like phospholipase family protein [Bradyrhizobium sp.]